MQHHPVIVNELSSTSQIWILKEPNLKTDEHDFCIYVMYQEKIWTFNLLAWNKKILKTGPD